MRKASVIAILASATLSACAGAPEMKMTPAAHDESVGVRFAQGEAAMVSPGKSGVVELLPVRYNGGTGEIIFVVAAYNHYDDAINFGPEDVSIRLGDGTPIAVEDFDRQRHDAKAEANAERVLAATQAAVGVWRAERAARRDPALGEALFGDAADGFRERMDAIDFDLAAAIGRMRSLLQTTTIDPGAAWAGVVAARQPPLVDGAARTLYVKVDFIGESHQFKLLIAPEGTPTRVRNLPAVTRAGMERLQGTPPTWLWDAPSEVPDEPVIAKSRF
jgi:hypothetical protein